MHSRRINKNDVEQINSVLHVIDPTETPIE